MQNVNLHQQKLYALLEAALALIAIFLPWLTASAGGFGISRSTNGFGGWGLLSVLGIAGVVVASLMGDKTKPYDDQTKKIAIASFGAIALGAIIYFIRIQSLGGNQQSGFYIVDVKTKAGAGLWLALAAGLIGLAWVTGILSKFSSGTGTTTTPPPPQPPMPPANPPL